MPDWLRQDGQGVIIEVVVQPRASRTKIVGLHDGRLKISLKAPPVDGAANAELLRFLAKSCGCPKSSASLIRGQTAKRKTVRLDGVALKKALELLEES